MRRTGTILLSFSCAVAIAACTKAPEPKKATDSVGAVQGSGGSPGGHADLPPIPDGPVAIVNGTEITSEAFHAIYDLKLQKYEDRGREIPKTADRRYRKSIVDRLIYQEVLRQESKKRNISYDEAELQQREEAQKRGIKDWDKHLRRRGESADSLRQLYVAELLERAILEADGQLEVTEAEVQEEFDKIKGNYTKDKERVRARHILVRVGPKDPPPPGEPVPEPTEEQKQAWEAEALKKAQEIHEKALAEGADFAQLAIDFSEGPSARKGGDLGIFTSDRMVEEFSDAAFTLEPGQVSEPVKTKFGFHIIKVEGKYAPGELPREALEDQIVERLSARKLHQGRRDLKEKLLESYEVKNIMEDLLGPDPRAERRKKARTQGHPPGGPRGHGPKPAPADGETAVAPPGPGGPTGVPTDTTKPPGDDGTTPPAPEKGEPPPAPEPGEK